MVGEAIKAENLNKKKGRFRIRRRPLNLIVPMCYLVIAEVEVSFLIWL